MRRMRGSSAQRRRIISTVASVDPLSMKMMSKLSLAFCSSEVTARAMAAALSCSLRHGMTTDISGRSLVLCIAFLNDDSVARRRPQPVEFNGAPKQKQRERYRRGCEVDLSGRVDERRLQQPDICGRSQVLDRGSLEVPHITVV